MMNDIAKAIFWSVICTIYVLTIGGGMLLIKYTISHESYDDMSEVVFSVTDRVKACFFGFVEAVQAIFLTLKLIGEVNWGWGLVLSPLLVTLLLIIAMLVMRRIAEYKKNLSRKLPHGIKIITDHGNNLDVEEVKPGKVFRFRLTCFFDRKNRRFVRINGGRYYV